MPDAIDSEWAGVIQVPRLILRFPGLLSGPRGDRRSVIVLPGRGTGDATTLPLRAYLRLLGHRPEGWGLGVNHGRVDELIGPMVDRVRAAADAEGRAVPLVGQSMGGFIAREVARLLPDEVAQVVTIGTPIFHARSDGPIRCPVTAIYSEADRVVSTARSIDTNPATHNIGVGSTHFAMGIDPDIWRIVAYRLTMPSQRMRRCPREQQLPRRLFARRGPGRRSGLPTWSRG